MRIGPTNTVEYYVIQLCHVRYTNLHSIADAENWQSALKYIRIIARRILGIDRAGPSRDNNCSKKTFTNDIKDIHK